MKKRIVALFLVVVTLVSVTTLANAIEFIPNSSAPEVVYTPNAKVVSTRVSLRVAPDEKSDRILYLKNGQEIAVLAEQNGWYIVYDGEHEGYAQKQYIKMQPGYVTLPKETILWADPWGTGIANGSKSKGAVLLVVSENNEWLCVQTNDGQAGSSFIQKSTLAGGTDYVWQNGYVANGKQQAVVACDTLAVRREPYDDVEPVGYAHHGDVLEVITRGDYFTGVVWLIGGQRTQCWVHSWHLQDIIP